MCEPTLILAIAAGGAQTFLQTRQQDAAWEAEVAAVDRSNVMAHQNYQNQLNIAVRDDENKGNIFFAELGRAATERSNYWKQKLINQIEELEPFKEPKKELLKVNRHRPFPSLKIVNN